MTHIERVADRIVVSTEWTDRELIKQLPGSRWDSDIKKWTTPLSWAACLQLRGLFGDQLEIGPELQQWSWSEFSTRVEPARALRDKITRSQPDLYDKSLYDFQTSGAEFLFTTRGGLLGDDLGMGKTAQILATLQRIEKSGDQAFPALVICPNSVKTGWSAQLHKWKINATPYVISGGSAQRRKIIEQARNDPRALVIINIESVRLFSRLSPYGSVALSRCRSCDKKHGGENITVARCEVHPKPLNGFGFKTVILDEAHRIKDPQSKQTRACWAVAHDGSVQQRFALTGTPIANHVGDLWSIMHFIAPSEYPTKSKFVDRYALQAWNAFGGLDIVGVNPANSVEFYNILDSRFRRTPKSLVLPQLPRVVRTTRWVDMVPKQEKAYRELADGLITVLENGEILIAQNNLVNATRLLQLSSSYCNVEAVKAPLNVLAKCPCYALGLDAHADDCAWGWHHVVTLAEPSPKLDAMEEAYDELGGKPVVIAAESRQLIDLAAKRFAKNKIPYGLITGPVSEYDRQQAIHRFRQGHINVILMTIAAGGTGVDGLQHADTMFFLQRSWSMIQNVQADGRVDRIGSEKHDSVTIVDFVTRGSIEETTQYPRLIEKLMRLEEINRDRARLLKTSDSIDTSALDREEDYILNSHLNVPMSGA